EAGVAVGLAVVVEATAGEQEDEQRGRAGPGLVELDEAAEDAVVVVAAGALAVDDEPRLVVVAGGGPAHGLEQAGELRLGQRLGPEGARRRTVEQQREDGGVGLACGHVDGVSSTRARGPRGAPLQRCAAIS